MHEQDSNPEQFPSDPTKIALRKMRWVLHANETLFYQIWERASDAMALSDAEGIVLAANPAYLGLYGYKLEEVMGNSFAIIFPEEQREWAEEQYKIMFSRDVTPATYESTVTRADGTERIVEATPTFLTEGGKRTLLLSMIRDITERKQSERELLHLNEMLAMLQGGSNPEHDDALNGRM